MGRTVSNELAFARERRRPRRQGGRAGSSMVSRQHVNEHRGGRQALVGVSPEHCITIGLWNFFPMHMRGVEPTFTGMSYGLLAIDPCLPIAIILAAIAFAGPFASRPLQPLWSRWLALTVVTLFPAVIVNQPTPWMGAAERSGQYATNLW